MLITFSENEDDKKKSAKKLKYKIIDKTLYISFYYVKLWKTSAKIRSLKIIINIPNLFQKKETKNVSKLTTSQSLRSRTKLTKIIANYNLWFIYF